MALDEDKLAMGTGASYLKVMSYIIFKPIRTSGKSRIFA